MSKCISINGEYSEHEPSNQEFVCGRCFAFDEDAVVAEVDSLRQKLAERDALIESQARQIAALTGSIRDISTGWDETLEQLAERDAVIDAVDDWFNGLGDAVCPDGERLARLLDASPSAVLAEHDARVLEDLIGRLVTVGWSRSARDWLRKRAAEYRKGAGQ